MSPKQIAEMLEKHITTIGRIAGKMAQSGEIKTINYGKYGPSISAVSSVSSLPGFELRTKARKSEVFTDEELKLSTQVILSPLTFYPHQELTKLTELTGVQGFHPIRQNGKPWQMMCAALKR